MKETKLSKGLTNESIGATVQALYDYMTKSRRQGDVADAEFIDRMASKMADGEEFLPHEVTRIKNIATSRLGA